VFIAQARVTAAIPRGVCFAPFHWGRMAGKFKAANNLTHRALDPISKQPEIKYCAVNIVSVGNFPDAPLANSNSAPLQDGTREVNESA
jgi:anaerobic selenocysteine-containing dehydrogenase